MDVIILPLWILFWCIYYVAQGRHDVEFLKEIRLVKDYIKPADVRKIDSEIIQKELNWKFWDGVEKLLAKLALTGFVYLLTTNLIKSLLLFVICVFIRWLVHDLVVSVGLGKGFRYIGPDWIWSDRILRRLSEKGVNQYFVKIIPLVILIAAYWLCQ